MAISFSQSPFETLSPDLRQHVESLIERRVFRKGEYLFVKGTPHQGLYWLRSGVALAYRTKDDGSYELAAPIHRGLWTGPSLVIGVHSISQRAITKCEVDWIAAEHTKTLKDQPEFSALVSHWCAEDFALTIAASAAINKTRAEDKILSFIRQTIKLAGEDPDIDADTLTGEIPWPFSIVQLAEFTQLSRPHVSKVMTKLAADKRIVLKNKTLKLLS